MKYRRLRDNEIIRSGDEFKAENGKWDRSTMQGWKVGELCLEYRRPIKPKKANPQTKKKGKVGL